MKSFIFCFGFLLLSIFSSAQNNYIEVSVTDTVVVLADQFTFHLMIMHDAFIEPDAVRATRKEYMKTESEIRARQKQMLDDLEIRLKTSGFLVAPMGISDMMASRGFGNYYLVYQIQSVEDLRKFQTVLKSEKHVHTMLQNVTTKQEEVHQKRLYLKLLEKARSRAAYLAGISDKKINSIISISDHVDNYYGRQPYPSTSVTKVSEEPTNINTSYPLNGRMVVRFLWN
jgi:hypothetical protein